MSHARMTTLVLSSFSNYVPRSIFFTSFFLSMEDNSATFQNILILLGSIIEYANMDCNMQE